MGFNFIIFNMRCFRKVDLKLIMINVLIFTVIVLWKLLSTKTSPAELHFDYFKIRDNAAGGWSYLVDTPNCKILNMSEWDESIRPFYRPPEFHHKIWPFECHKRSIRHWTYVENSSIVINETALKETGYSMKSISCCYKTITRVEQTEDNFDPPTADSRIKFSSDCYPMQQRTKLDHEFIRVICSSKYFPVPNGVLYKQFHPIPIPDVISSEKTKFWTENNINRPPSILIFGIDAMSRLNFRRGMPKTREVLEKNGAVEMFGYTKVGENTWPNVAVLLSGYDWSKLQNLCWKDELGTIHDSCPCIWKDFAKANYATALIEDRIELSAFNFKMIGFIKKPVDFYFRSLMLGVYEHAPYYQMRIRQKPNAMDCIGHKTTDQVQLEYNDALSNLSLPVFSFTWNTNLAHEDMTAPRNVDNLYADYFKRQCAKNNTIVFFVSDHGNRYGDLRQSMPGWYEDKLPNLWIHISNDLRERFPDWYQNLQRNSRTLSSPFDLHQTLIHVLQNFTDVKISRESAGSSFFLPIPERTCNEAKISSEFCPCSMPEALPADNSQVQLAAKAVLTFLNLQLPRQCFPLSLDRVTAGAIINTFGEETAYLVTFLAQPGDILLEANVKYHSETELFDAKTELTRLNAMTRSVKCIRDSYLEKFCYCP